MVNKKEFRVIRNTVMTLRTAFLHNISKENEGLTPVVASAIDVEEDGHLWMLVNSKMKKWEERSNIPVKLEFVPGDCHLRLSGIGHITLPEQIPPHLRDQAKHAKAIMRMKLFYGEYLPLSDHSRKQKDIPSTGDLFSRISENITGRTYRRHLFFR